MTNLFDDAEGRFQVLVNDEGQHTPRPELLNVSAGSTAVSPTDSGRRCLDYVESHWTGVRARSIVAAKVAVEGHDRS